MNHDETKPDLQSWMDPALEARVIAWVLGEASAFEVAELERLIAESPELGIFKRRIEAVHGLVGEAVRPVRLPLRLSPERRAKVLAVIGAVETQPVAAVADAWAAKEEAVFKAQKGRSGGGGGGWRAWVMPLAACVAILGLLAAIVIPTVGKVRGSAGHGDVAYLKVNTDTAQSHSAEAGVSGGMNAANEGPSNAPSGEVRFEMAALAPPASAPAPVMAPPPPSPSEMSAPLFRLDAANDVGGAAVVDADSRVTKERARQAEVVGKKMEEPKAVGLGFAEPADARRLTYEEFGKQKRQALNGAVAREGVSESEDGYAMREEKFGVDGSELELQSIRAAYKGMTDRERLNAVASQVRRRRAPSKSTLDYFAPVMPADEPVVFGDMEVSAAKDADNRVTTGTTPGLSLQSVVKGDAASSVEVDKAVAKPATSAVDDSLRGEVSAANEAVSTFSLHVSNASYRLARAALARGAAPDAATIRPEEFYNAFDYGDAAPAAGEPVAGRIEQAAHPFMQQRNLVRVALRVPAAGRGAGTALRLTVLLDTSGSMEREDRAATVRAALGALATLLGPNDRVTVIGFARQPRLLVESLPGDQAGRLVELAANTPAEGGTNLEEALRLAGELARRQFVAGAQNRIVLLTDGAANLGDADPARLMAQVEGLRRQGVAFDACGVGAAGLDDTVLESLTRKGDGRYQVLNSPEEADAGFARKLAGAFRPAAENVKVQVRFNPARVGRYRLIGFEKHRLREEDFRNDKVDAAELAAEEAAVALYQVEVLPGGEGELGDVAVRFRDTARGQMVERTWTLDYVAQPPAFDKASASLRLAGASALLAEKLRGGAVGGQIRLEELAPVVAGLRSAYAGDARVQDFVTMFTEARRLTGE